MRDVVPVGERDEAEALLFDVAGDLLDLGRVVLFLGVDDEEGACVERWTKEERFF